MAKVKVRIAVAVDPNGDWNSAGWMSGSDKEKMGICIESLDCGEARYWLEAELQIPDVPTIAADVTPNLKLSGGA